MKKFYAVILLASSLFAGTSNAQITISTAPDFTVTDLLGNSTNLYTVLGQGKYVVIDFFFTTCVPCQGAAPKFKTAFQNYGCNNGNVIFMSVDQGNTNAQCQTYETQFVGANGPPMISGTQGSGNSVCSAFGSAAYPTFILIAPNKQILEKDMWPINAATDFDPYLSSHGLSYSTCATGVAEVASPFHFSMFPNPASTLLNVESNNGSELLSYKVYDFMGKEALSGSNGSGNTKVAVEVSSLTHGFYFVEIMTSEGLLVRKFNKQ